MGAAGHRGPTRRTHRRTRTGRLAQAGGRTFNGRDSYFVEIRTEHVEGRRIAYVIEQDTFGLGRVMTEPGFALDIEPAGPGRSRVTFSFFHHPKGVLGHVMNVLVVLRQQRRNRRAALASLKQVAEAGRL